VHTSAKPSNNILSNLLYILVRKYQKAFDIKILSLLLSIAVSAQSMMTKNEPMFISRSETFKFITGETIVLPCEVANTGELWVSRQLALLTHSLKRIKLFAIAFWHRRCS